MQKNNLGISMISLVIAIIILLILLGISLTTATTLINSAKESKFIEDMTKIQNVISQYYIGTGTLPIKETSPNRTALEIINSVENYKLKDKLAEEIFLNADDDSTFYTVDLGLMGVDTMSLDLQDNRNNFVISSEGQMVYYLNGIKIWNNVYYSLSSKLSGKKQIVNLDQDLEDIIMGDKIQLIKDVNVWTNEIRIKVRTDLTGTEYLQYYIAGVSADIRTVESTTKEIVIIVNGNMMTQNERDYFMAADEDKKITVQKKSGTEIISEKTISINNLDIQEPMIINIDTEDTSNAAYNLIKVTSNDVGGSGVKQISYIYDMKLDYKGEIVEYYNDELPIIDRILYSGKVSKDGEIKLPKNISRIVTVAIDNAGNLTEMYEYDIHIDNLISE